MKQKKKWITIKKEEKNGIKIKTSINITGLDVIDMLTAIICKTLADTAKLNLLDVTSEELSERYKKYMLDYLKDFMK